MPARSVDQELVRLRLNVDKLREEIRGGARPSEIGAGAALLCVDQISRILSYCDQVDQLISYQLFWEGETLVQKIRRMKTAIRVFGQLNRMFVAGIDSLFKCVGGTQTIAVENIVEWAKGDPARTHLTERFFSSVARRTNRQKRNKTKKPVSHLHSRRRRQNKHHLLTFPLEFATEN